MTRFVIAALCLLLTSSVQAGFPFDPDGAGAKPTFQVGAIDFVVGNSLSKGVMAGEQWTLYYQASVGSLADEQGSPIPNDGPAGTGLNVDHEITVVLGISVRTTAAAPFLNFALQPGGTNFIRIYHDTKVNANPLEGTGYDDGTLILESHATDSLEGASMVFGRPVNLDSFGGSNQWPGVRSLSSVGALQASSVVSSFNRSFFLVNNISRININSSQAAPYRQTKPSKRFLDVVPAVGSVNLQSGPDVLIQADANASFVVE
mgnify:CR=1 FL=1